MEGKLSDAIAQEVERLRKNNLWKTWAEMHGLPYPKTEEERRAIIRNYLKEPNNNDEEERP